MIPYGRQSIDESDIDAITKVLNSEYLTTGPVVDEFERKLTEFHSNTATFSVSSGTAALHCAYVGAEIGPGDEVITPPLTFIATQATAALCGAKIVFSDIEPDTGNLDPNLIEEKITDKTKAVVVVDYAGHPCDLDKFKEITEKYQIKLIEDASHSFGSKYKARMVGSIADITTFSFFPTKNITTGEGGAVAAKDPEIFARAKRFARQGLIREKKDFKLIPYGPWHQEVQNFGLNYRLPDILAALGLSQLKRVEGFKMKREEIYNTYNHEFQNINELQTPPKKPYADPFWHLYPLRIKPELRLPLYEYLHQNEIKVQINYLPVNLNPVFQNKYTEKSFPAAYDYFAQEISLPIFHNLEVDKIKKISKLIKEFIFNV